MKKLIYFLPFLFILISCESVLDVSPTQSIAADEAITDKNGIKRALTGCYDALQQGGYYAHNYVLFAGLTSDNLRATGTKVEYSELESNSFLADNGFIEGIWNAIFRSINRVNNVLYYLDGVGDITDAERTDFEAQCLFLRGLHYYNLVRYFGGVPLKSKPSLNATGLDIPRSSESEVYQFIISDLEAAKGNISTTSSKRANNNAVLALLAKVNLEMGNYSEAATLASEVINSSSHSLESDYANIFEESGSSSEIIFQVDFDAQDKNVLAQYFFPGSLAGRKEATPSISLIESYENSDTRIAASINDILASPYNESYCIKYSDVSTGTDNVFVIRLAEMYLLRAEANARANGNVADIQNDINTIRNRAGLSDTQASNHNALLDAILNERRHELAFEGSRWFDLVRFEKHDGKTILPIPLAEIQTNASINESDQNPGY